MRILRNWDVSSYYPSLMLVNRYYSRSIPSFEKYKEVYDTRIAAKKRGDKDLANSYKLVLNTCYGATLNRTNPLYDPLNARSVCISGQLYLLELAVHVYRDVPGVVVTECNTDGLQLELDEERLEDVRAIVREWEERTGFTMEEEAITKSVAKDVNNYVQIIDGEVKVKGGMLVRGVSPAGAFNINNTAVIVADALREYLAFGTPPEETIGACGEPLKFQFVAKASHKYSHVFHIVDGERAEVQRCNRVYATKDMRLGTLIKVHAEAGNDNKMAGLPEHCLIDNDNHCSIEDIDKGFYVDMAWNQITAFLGYDPRTVKEEESMNIHGKLLKAQVEFLSAGVEKTGKNMGLKYKYFELQDIVPVALPIFDKYGIAPEFSFDNDMAMLTLVNVDEPNEAVVFTSPNRELEPVLNASGKEVANVMQRQGMVQTYQRRYLLMMALNIVEPDGIDAPQMLTPPTVAQSPVVKMPEIPKAKAAEPVAEKKPAPTVNLLPDRHAENTSNEPAGSIQKTQLKKAMLKYKEAHPEAAAGIARIVKREMDTLTRARCEELLKQYSDAQNW